MILHLLRMRRNVNRNVFNDRKNVSATPVQITALDRGTGTLPLSRAVVRFVEVDIYVDL